MLFFHLSPLAGEFYIRNFKKTDMSVFLETLSHIPWHIIENATDIEESWQLFKDLLFSVVDMTIPHFKWKSKS